MTGANEIVALKSLGISPMAVVWPVLALAAFTSLGTIWMYEIAATWCRPNFRRLVCESIEEIAYSRLQKKSSFDCDLFSITVKRVENRDGRRILIQPTITLKSQPGQHKVTLTAAEAEFHTNWKAGTLEIICRNGEIDVDDGHMKMSFVDEQTYSVPLPKPTWDPRHRDWAASGDIPGLIAEIQAEIDALQKNLRSLEKLREANKALGVAASHDDAAQIAAQIADKQRLIYRLRTEPYRRWSNGFTCLCFALIGMPVAMLWRHADGLTNFFVCFLPILAVYYPLLMIGEDLSTSGTLPPISFWMGNVILAVPAVAAAAVDRAALTAPRAAIRFRTDRATAGVQTFLSVRCFWTHRTDRMSAPDSSALLCGRLEVRPTPSGGRGPVEEVGEFAGAGGLLQFVERFDFDLTNPLPRDGEDLPHLGERVSIAVREAIAESNDLAFPVVERLEGFGDSRLERIAVEAQQGIVVAAVGEQFAEVVFAFVAQRLVEREHAAVGL